MEDNLFNECLNIVDQIVDQQICPDCEHPRCLSRRQSAAKRIEQLVQDGTTTPKDMDS